jgi:tricorn protease
VGVNASAGDWIVAVNGRPTLDGGSLSKPEFSRFDLAGREWIVENTG